MVSERCQGNHELLGCVGGCVTAPSFMLVRTCSCDSELSILMSAQITLSKKASLKRFNLRSWWDAKLDTYSHRSEPLLSRLERPLAIGLG